MKTQNEIFINTARNNEDKTDDFQESNSGEDPFGDIIQDVEDPKYYRLNEKVFAEPLETCLVEKKSESDIDTESTSDIMFEGNVGVQKRAGRRNKYFIDKEDVAKMTCPQDNCQRKFSKPTLLKAHIRKVHCADKNSFICDQCGAGFKARYLLMRHSVIHEGRTVKCYVCGKVLSARTNLSTHIRSHSVDRPHSCVCGKRFLRKAALRRHERVHTHR